MVYVVDTTMIPELW